MVFLSSCRQTKSSAKRNWRRFWLLLPSERKVVSLLPYLQFTMLLVLFETKTTLIMYSSKESCIYWSRNHVSQQTIYYQIYFPFLSFVFALPCACVDVRRGENVIQVLFVFHLINWIINIRVVWNREWFWLEDVLPAYIQTKTSPEIHHEQDLWFVSVLNNRDKISSAYKCPGRRVLNKV